MHSSFQSVARQLLSEDTAFAPVKVPGSNIWIMVTAKGAVDDSDYEAHEQTTSSGGGVCIMVEYKYKEIPVGSYLLCVAKKLVDDLGIDCGMFVLGHEYGHALYKLNGVPQGATLEENFKVENTCDQVGVLVAGTEAGKKFINFFLEKLSGFETGALLSVPSEHQAEAKKQVAMVMELMILRRAAIS